MDNATVNAKPGIASLARDALLRPSHFRAGALIAVQWFVAFGIYLVVILGPFSEMQMSGAMNDNPLKTYFFQAMPIIFLAAVLYYWDRRDYAGAHLAAWAPVIVPFTAWGFIGIANATAVVIYKILI